MLRNILTGGVDLQLEEILAEGGGFTQCESADILKKRNRARVAVLEIRELIPDIDTRVSRERVLVLSEHSSSIDESGDVQRSIL